MFNTFVRPILEFSTPAWSPHHVNLITAVEKVRRNFTARIPGLRDFDYPTRLQILNLKSLEERRLIYDLLELFKIVKGKSIIKFIDHFEFKRGQSTRRRNELQIQLKTPSTTIARHFFKFRATKIWNALPNDIVAVNSVDQFKLRLKKFDFSEFLICFPTSYHH